MWRHQGRAIDLLFFFFFFFFSFGQWWKKGSESGSVDTASEPMQADHMWRLRQSARERERRSASEERRKEKLEGAGQTAERRKIRKTARRSFSLTSALRRAQAQAPRDALCFPFIGVRLSEREVWRSGERKRGLKGRRDGVQSNLQGRRHTNRRSRQRTRFPIGCLRTGPQCERSDGPQLLYEAAEAQGQAG